MSGANQNVNVTISGQAGGAVSAFQQVTGASNQTQTALQQLTDALNRASAQMNLAQRASTLLGQAAAQQMMGWLQASKGAQEYSSRLGYMQAYLNNASTSQNQLTNQNQIQAVSWGSLKQGVLDNMGPMGQWIVLGGSVVSLLTPLISGLTDAAKTVFDFGAKLIEIPFDAAIQGFQAMASEVQNLTMQVFQLNEATEKNFVNWAFLWGGVNPATSMGPGVGPARELSQWSLKASLLMPWTRQDLMQSITTLSGMDNESVPKMEHQLVLLSDVAATQGRPGITLNWAAMAAMRGEQGQRRMLLYELKLTPQELAKYGYDESNSATFWPSLESYAKARGEYGASAYISTHTFWGAQTSLVDRLQNFGLAVGGWNNNPQGLTDDVTQGSFFAGLKGGLVDISGWIDQHQGDIGRLANLFGTILAGGVDSARTAVSALADGLNKSGIVDWLIGTDVTVRTKKGGRKDLGRQGGVLQDIGDWLNSKDVQGTLKEWGQLLGGIIGPAMKDIGEGARHFAEAFGNTGIGRDISDALKNIGTWFANPDTQKGIQELGDTLGGIAGSGLQAVLGALQALFAGITGTNLGGDAMSGLKNLEAWLNDPTHQAQIRQVAFIIGGTLADSFRLAAQTVGNLTTALLDGGKVLADYFVLIKDVMSGNTVAIGLDMQRLVNDWKQGLVDMSQGTANWLNDWQKLLGAITNPPPLANFLPPSSSGSGGTGGKPGSNGGHKPNPTILQRLSKLIEENDPAQWRTAGGGTDLAKASGAQASQSLIQGAMDEMTRQQNGQTIITQMMTGMQRQLTVAAPQVGTALAQTILQLAQKAIEEVLASGDFTASLLFRQPGLVDIGGRYGVR